MSIHTVHKDSHIHGLADDCPRCEEHAQNPFNALDNEMLGNLLRRCVAGEPGRSHNEEEAMFNLQIILQQSVELAKLDPDAYVKYFKQRGVLLPEAP